MVGSDKNGLESEAVIKTSPLAPACPVPLVIENREPRGVE